MAVRLSVLDSSGGTAAVRTWMLGTDESTTVDEVAQSLKLPAELIAPGADPASPLLDAGVLSGSILPQWSAATLPPGQLRLEVVGGPFSGETFPVTPGIPVRIGSSAAMDLCIADPYLAQHHVTLILQRGDAEGGLRGPLKATVRAESDAHPVLVNGERIQGSAEIVPVDLIQIGGSMFRIGVEPASDADLSREEAGLRGFNRPSRIQPRRQAPVLMLPGDRPEDAENTPLNWLSALLPIVLGVTMAFVFNRPIMLLMAAAAPIMVVGSFMMNRRRLKKKGVRTSQQWEQEVKDARVQLSRQVREQRIDNWYRHPDPVLIRDIACRPLARLWERRKSDPDALQLRVGVGDVDLEVRFEGGGQRDRSAERRVGVSPAPVAVDLTAGVVGIAGPDDVVRNTTRAILTSLAALRSPQDTQIVVLCDEESSLEWEWVQWLPHAQAGTSVVALLGNTDEARRDRLRALRDLMAARQRAVTERASSGFDTSLVVVVDGARRYRTLQGMAQLLEGGGAVGIHIIALDSDRSRLPEESKTVIEVDVDDRTIARVESVARYYPRVLLDGVSVTVAERIGRSLCSIQHVAGVGDEALIPPRLRLVDTLKLDLDDVAGLAKRWQQTPRRTRVAVGEDAEGEFTLDIAGQGPHALVAGTTGSGKSEFLQTLVASLALANRPDALNFVLVDYKGGSAFADCEHLPHTVGMVTNLDERETERALVSLDAEIKRRERVITRELGAKDLDDAWAKDPEAAAAQGLARLMIVIDEFAELKSELPEFVDGLVRIARVGRSLGLHLVLATQRPSGVITPEMQSNINLRVALRVADRGDSADVLGSVDASLISVATPGRAFQRAEAGGSPLGFQTGRVAGIRPGVHRVRRSLPPAATAEWKGLGLAPAFPRRGGAAEERDREDTDLRAIVKLINGAAQSLGITKNPSPWLLPLPPVLPYRRVQTDEAAETALVLGLQDIPDRQVQEPLLWDVATESHLAFLGSPQSGRTTILRTLLGQALQRFAPGDLHLYAIDFGTGALGPVAAAPHTGALVTALDSERLPRLMTRLLDELSDRQARLSDLGLSSIGEQRRSAAAGEGLPYVILAIDGWERVMAQLSPEESHSLREQVLRLLREGGAVGIRLVVTGDRSFPGDKIAGFIERQFVLPLRDVNDYRAAGIMIRTLPESLPPGRALFGSGGAEVQLASLGQEVGGEQQLTRLREIVQEAQERQGESPVAPAPLRVDPLPKHFPLSAAFELPLAPGVVAEMPVVGIGGDTVSRFTIEWPETGGFIVVGERQAGKSSTLAAIAQQLAWANTPMLMVATKESPLTQLASQLGLTVLSDTGMLAGDVDSVLKGYDATPLTVIVDDAELLKDSFLEQALNAGAAKLAFIVAADAHASARLHSGPFARARSGQAGLVLSPTSAQQGAPAFGQNIPRNLLGRRPRGGGLFYRSGQFTPVQVPDVLR